jgi:hypothetical protein
MPRGRPSSYRPEYAEQARKLALLGQTDKQLAEFFGVNPDTIYEWDKKYPEFAEIRTRGKEIADGEVAASLWQRALGYSHDDVHVTAYEGDVTLTPIVKHYPPDFQSASLWLRNRQPDLWKEKVDINHSGRIDTAMAPYNPALLTEEQREVMRDALLTIGPTIEGEKE